MFTRGAVVPPRTAVRGHWSRKDVRSKCQRVAHLCTVEAFAHELASMHEHSSMYSYTHNASSRGAITLDRTWYADPGRRPSFRSAC